MIHSKVIIQRVIFPTLESKDWRSYLSSKLRSFQKGLIEIDTRDWGLKCRDIKDLENLCNSFNLKMIFLESYIPETIVSASSLGIRSTLKLKEHQKPTQISEYNFPDKYQKPTVFFHQGTLRSGERLETDEDLLIVGDINPGAMVSAGGDVMIWGRLLGIAHAGKNGDINAKICALQLRPVQLRIADKIARVPKESPEEGLAEEAIVQQGVILIRPAKAK